MTNELQLRLLSRLKAAQTPGEHPDAETLSLFRERKLKARGRETVTDHLSRCAVCRDTLLLSSQSIPEKRRSHPAWLTAAAAFIMFFAGVATSRRDIGIIHWSLSQPGSREQLLPTALSPKISYAVADVQIPAAPSQWRIRNSALESSVDMGKTWRRARLDRRFNAQEVRYNGSDVWVRSQSGELLLSRDAGLHWTFLNPAKGR